MTINFVKVREAIDPVYTRRFAIQARRVDAEHCYDVVRIPDNFRRIASYRGDLNTREKTGLWSSAEKLRSEFSGDDLPPFVFPCFYRQPNIDCGNVVDWIVGVVENELECPVHEDEFVGWTEFCLAFEKFSQAQRGPNGIFCWHEDFTRVIVLDEARFAAFLKEE